MIMKRKETKRIYTKKLINVTLCSNQVTGYGYDIS